MFNPEEIKKDFPIFKRQIHGQPLVYLDSAATAQKPQSVIDALVEYYSQHNANVHRGVHTLGDESTRLYTQSRNQIAKFFGAQPEELVFVRNTTEALNLVAYGWARPHLKAGDMIVTTELEHHSNLVVWQEVARESGAELTFVDITDNGQIDVDHLKAILETLGHQIKLIALTYISNTTGAVLDLAKVAELIRSNTTECPIVVDAAQAAPQKAIDFSELDIDFMAFSGHKLYGPMGVGGLLGKHQTLEQLNPVFVGGGMIDEVYLFGTTYASLPDRLDAGTPNVADAVGLARAVEYLSSLGMDNVERHSRDLVQYALNRLSELDHIQLIGPTDALQRLGSVAFVMGGIHAHDIAQILDSQGVEVRSGHHCTMPLHQKLQLPASVRASFGVYNTIQDIDRLVEGLEQVKKIFKLSP